MTSPNCVKYQPDSPNYIRLPWQLNKRGLCESSIPDWWRKVADRLVVEYDRYLEYDRYPEFSEYTRYPIKETWAWFHFLLAIIFIVVGLDSEVHDILKKFIFFKVLIKNIKRIFIGFSALDYHPQYTGYKLGTKIKQERKWWSLE